MGSDILLKLGITLTANRKSGRKVLQVIESLTETNVIEWMSKKYPQLSTRIGKSNNHIAKLILKENYAPIHQKGKRVPLHILEKVEKTQKKLIDEKQIVKLDKCSDENFSRVVKTAKVDKSIKITPGLNRLKDAIHKNKQQKESIDHLINEVATYFS